TDEAASQFDNQYSYSLFQRRPNSFSTISLVARGRPTDTLGLDFRMEYDPVAGPIDPNNPAAGNSPTLVGLGMNGSIRTGPVEASAGWNKQNYGGFNQFQSNHYVQQSTTLRLLDNRVGATIQFNYDIGRSMLLQQRYIANYSAQCCGISFEY